MLAKTINPFLNACEGIWSFGSSTNSVSFCMENRVVASLLTHRENHYQIAYQLQWKNPRLVNPMWGPGMFLMGREMRNLFMEKSQISLRCLWRRVIHCWISCINLFVTSSNEGPNDCCVNASLVLFSPQSVLLISMFRIYITVISDVVRGLFTGYPCWRVNLQWTQLVAESGSRDSLIVVFNSVSFWKDTDGLTVASVLIHLYFSGGRAVGTLTINTSLFTASCAVSPSPTWIDKDFLFRVSVDVKVSVCVFGPMTWDKDCWCSAL